MNWKVFLTALAAGVTAGGILLGIVTILIRLTIAFGWWVVPLAIIAIFAIIFAIIMGVDAAKPQVRTSYNGKTWEG